MHAIMLGHEDLWSSGPEQTKRLKHATANEAHRAVRALCEAVEHDRYVDDEMLMYAGRALGTAGHAGIDEGVTKWWLEFDSERRAEIAASLLWGYWTTAPSLSLDAALPSLRRVVAEQPLASPAWSLATVALATVARRADLQAVVRNAIQPEIRDARDQLVKAERHPQLVQMLSELL